MNKAILIIIITVLAAAGIAAVISLWPKPNLEPNIDGRLTGYEKDNDFSIAMFIAAEEGFADDIEKCPEEYSLYWVHMDIWNATDHGIYYLNSKLEKVYSNVWLSDTFTIYDIDVDLKEAEVVNDWGFYILVKTANMSETEIDQLIRSIGLTIRARNATDAPAFASSTIYFEQQSLVMVKHCFG